MDFHATSIELKSFDLKHTFESAQPLTFHADYNPALNSLVYSSGKNLISVTFVGSKKRGKLIMVGENLEHASNDVMRRFRVSDNMQQIYKKINTDKFIDFSIKNFEGLRLTLNDPWETTLCYIISQYNNVKRIRLITKNLISEFGEPILDKEGNEIGTAFPTSSTLKDATIRELMDCGTGFRAKYIKSAAEYCTNNLDLYKLNPNKYNELKEQLMTIDGVGDKVADCIILMGYGNMQACPIDVWVKRTIEKIYFKGKEKKIELIHDFVDRRWPGVQGYAQQYIFWGGRQINEEAKEYLLVK